MELEEGAFHLKLSCKGARLFLKQEGAFCHFCYRYASGNLPEGAADRGLGGIRLSLQ